MDRTLFEIRVEGIFVENKRNEKENTTKKKVFEEKNRVDKMTRSKIIVAHQYLLLSERSEFRKEFNSSENCQTDRVFLDNNRNSQLHG